MTRIFTTSALLLSLVSPAFAEDQGNQTDTPIADALSANGAVSTETEAEAYFTLGDEVVVDAEDIDINDEIERLVSAVCAGYSCDLKEVQESTQEEQARALLAAQTAIIEARSAVAVAKAEAILAEAEAFRDASALNAAKAANALAKEVATVVPIEEHNATVDELATAEAAIAADKAADVAAERQNEIDALNARIEELEEQVAMTPTFGTSNIPLNGNSLALQDAVKMALTVCNDGLPEANQQVCDPIEGRSLAEAMEHFTN